MYTDDRFVRYLSSYLSRLRFITLFLYLYIVAKSITILCKCCYLLSIIAGAEKGEAASQHANNCRQVKHYGKSFHFDSQRLPQ